MFKKLPDHFYVYRDWVLLAVGVEVAELDLDGGVGHGPRAHVRGTDAVWTDAVGPKIFFFCKIM